MDYRVLPTARNRYLVAMQVGYYESPVLRDFIRCLLCHCMLYLNGFLNCKFSLAILLCNY